MEKLSDENIKEIIANSSIPALQIQLELIRRYIFDVKGVDVHRINLPIGSPIMALMTVGQFVTDFQLAEHYFNICVNYYKEKFK